MQRTYCGSREKFMTANWGAEIAFPALGQWWMWLLSRLRVDDGQLGNSPSGPATALSSSHRAATVAFSAEGGSWLDRSAEAVGKKISEEEPRVPKWVTDLGRQAR